METYTSPPFHQRNGGLVLFRLIGWAVLFIVSLVVGGILGAGALGIGALSGSLQEG